MREHNPALNPKTNSLVVIVRKQQHPLGSARCPARLNDQHTRTKLRFQQTAKHRIKSVSNPFRFRVSQYQHRPLRTVNELQPNHSVAIRVVRKDPNLPPNRNIIISDRKTKPHFSIHNRSILKAEQNRSTTHETHNRNNTHKKLGNPNKKFSPKKKFPRTVKAQPENFPPHGAGRPWPPPASVRAPRGVERVFVERVFDPWRSRTGVRRTYVLAPGRHAVPA